jgi:hypothetical protein
MHFPFEKMTAEKMTILYVSSSAGSHMLHRWIDAGWIETIQASRMRRHYTATRHEQHETAVKECYRQQVDRIPTFCHHFERNPHGERKKTQTKFPAAKILLQRV